MLSNQFTIRPDGSFLIDNQDCPRISFEELVMRVLQTFDGSDGGTSGFARLHGGLFRDVYSLDWLELGRRAPQYGRHPRLLAQLLSVLLSLLSGRRRR